MTKTLTETGLDREELRAAIQEEYAEVALAPDKGFHFHTGYPLAEMLGYKDEWLESVPPTAVHSFAGTGNPFSMGTLQPGEKVIDIGSGAGMDSLIAAEMVGPSGAVIGVDMTPEMVERAKRAQAQREVSWLDFHQGFAEELPVTDNWADVIISNGVLNLMPDKPAVLKEMARALKPNGRLQIGDILVERAVPTSAKQKIDLWTG